MAVTIRKRDGREEEFDPAKLGRSLQACGAKPELVESMLSRVTPAPDDTTSSLRQRVSAELSGRDNQVARCYQSTRRLHVTEADDVPDGTLRVHPTTAANYGWQPGEKVEVRHDDEKLKLRLEESASAGSLQAQINRRTLESLHAFEGTRVAISQAE